MFLRTRQSRDTSSANSTRKQQAPRQSRMGRQGQGTAPAQGQRSTSPRHTHHAAGGGYLFSTNASRHSDGITAGTQAPLTAQRLPGRPHAPHRKHDEQQGRPQKPQEHPGVKFSRNRGDQPTVRGSPRAASSTTSPAAARHRAATTRAGRAGPRPRGLSPWDTYSLTHTAKYYMKKT